MSAARRLEQDQRELLAAVAAGDVFPARVALEERAHRAQQRVAGGVAEGVVELLEVVDVDHDDAERHLPPPRPPQLAVQRLLHVAAVEEPGQGIADGLVAKALLEAQVREGEADLVGHGEGELPPRQDVMGAELRLLLLARVLDEVEDAEGGALRHQGHAHVGGRRRPSDVPADEPRVGAFHDMGAPAAQGPAVVGSEDLFRGRRRSPGGDALHDVAALVEHAEGAGLVGKEGAAVLLDDGVGLLHGMAGLQVVSRLGEEPHVLGTLLQLLDPVHQPLVGVLELGRARLHPPLQVVAGAAQGRLRLVPLGDVAQERGVQRAAVPFDRSDGHLDRELRAVGAPGHALHAPA